MAKEFGYTPVNIFAACCGILASSLALTNPITAGYAAGINVATNAIIGGIQLSEKEKSLGDKLIQAIDKEWINICRNYRLPEKCLEDLKNELMGEGTSVDEFIRNLESNRRILGYGHVEDGKRHLVDSLRPIITQILMKHKEELRRDPELKWDSLFISDVARKMAVRIVETIESILSNDVNLRILVAIAANRAADREEHKEIMEAFNEIKGVFTNESRIDNDSPTPSLLTSIPKGVDLIGRDNVIKAIKEQIDQYDVVSIKADGGVGKTAVALQIVNGIKKEITSGISTFKHLAWITSTGALSNDLAKLKIQGVKEQKTLKEKEIIVSGFLQQNPSFIVIDNMDIPPSSEEVNILNTISGRTKILITSRAIIKKVHSYHLQALDTQDAILLFYTNYLDTSERLKWKDVKNRLDLYYADKIVVKSANNALLIELISKMACWQYKDELNRLWERLEKDIFGTESEFEIEVDHHANEDISGHLSKSDLRLQGHIRRLYGLAGLDEIKQEIMSFISLFPAESVIFPDVFRWAGFEVSDLKWLTDRGWIERNEEGYLVHMMVKGSVIQQNRGIVFNEDKYEDLIYELADVNQYLSKDMVYTKVRERIIVPETICKLLVEKGSKKTLAVSLYNNLAVVYLSLGNYDEALKCYKEALVIREKFLGEENPFTAVIYNNIAGVYQAQGNYVEALKHYKKAQTIYEKFLGEEHPATAMTYDNIAGVYQAQGNYAEALDYSKKAKVINETFLGEEHPTTAVTYDNIAGLYEDQGDYDEALKYYKKAVMIFKQSFGEDHPDTATTYNNMAGTYHVLGNYAEALECYKKALSVREQVLGKEHPATAATYNNIAGVYRSQGNYDEALKYYKKALAIREQVLGENHPDRATTYDNMANVYREKGDYNEALKYYLKALVIREQVLGENHLDTTKTYSHIAGLYHLQGDHDEALIYFKKALEISKNLFGEEHLNTAAAYNNIACVYEDQGDHDEALKCYKKALGTTKKVLGEEHPAIATTYNNLANVYLAQGYYVKALRYYKKALTIQEKVPGEEHPDTATTYNNMAGVHQTQGNYSKALKYNKKALAIREKVLGEEHPDTATTYNNMANVYREQENYDEALKYYKKSLAVREKVLGEEHPDTATTYNNMAGIFEVRGDYDEAMKYYKKAFVFLKKVLGENHLYTATASNNIGILLYKMGDYESARDYFENAISAFEKVPGESNPDTITTKELLNMTLEKLKIQ